MGMDLARLREAEYRLTHQHTDGTWGEFEEVEHDSAAHDPERWWSIGRVFRCTSCDEQVVVVPQGEDKPVEDIE